MRSASRPTKARLCSTKTTVAPLARICSIAPASMSFSTLFRPAPGSSRYSSRAPEARARAAASSRCWPAVSWAAEVSASAAMPTVFRCIMACSDSVCAVPVFQPRPASPARKPLPLRRTPAAMTFSRTVSAVRISAAWKVRARPRTFTS
ncbi:Uncharacterised protein [Bordetella pertussis]|nr:Uncharacterised protein [Bordetella pertussis]CFN06432.1 Uncharacterised protein [Bordetella pertussis]CFN56256.1 Uncharacterised protein [Bordetella pertussis]CFN58331.1 Uncharacterised protein [Bordetella pertussis]CFN94060.1 Uncharacterised protein [Bordetella pertussis]